MKKEILLLVSMVFSIKVALAQFGDCDCSDPLNKDLKDNSVTYNSREVKNWFYRYFSAKEVERRKIKKESKSEWGMDFVIDAIPIGFSSDAQSSQDNNFYRQIEREVKNEGYFSDKQLELIITNKFSTNQLTAYTTCIKACIEDRRNRNGVLLTIDGNPDDIFYFKVVFNNTAGKEFLTLEEDIRYTNCEPIDGNIFKKGMSIKNGQSKIQCFKKTNKEKDAILTLNFTDGVTIDPIVIKSQKNKDNLVPVGTIVATILDFNTFCRVNKIDPDLTKTSWLPCDGRTIPTDCIYAESGASNTPDLRGVFLRGTNIMYSNNLGAGIIKPQQLNYETKLAGEFQNESFKKHKHDNGARLESGTNKKFQKFGYLETEQQVKGFAYANTWVDHNTGWTEEVGGDETRPKNISVFYYIKIR
ncbi:hypothetical protein GXP67_01095 [Rhodocytophaga rosea]|uniref:Tail fiber protein n=1 Tax=Rhodocytophaga rosea TaxID=2704465 RepID=A0A6C0GBL4_9BACT|nr:hypothetical protein [Rhodocytophaga rosea]QHT65369.1 hypothetical protein GXP67_01095 [Rhodocytophaga rosea]